MEKFKSKIAAVIVLFYPDKAIVLKMLNRIKSSVNVIYIIDNTPINESKSFNPSLTGKNISIIYKPLKDNYGIATAQNIGIKLAFEDKCDHIIFFDQDSLPDALMISKLLFKERFLLKSGIKVGAVGPAYIDSRTSDVGKIMRSKSLFFSSHKKIKKQSFIDVDILISSGCLIRTDVLIDVGLMKAEYFIDAVDTEWCLRSGYFGYKHYVVPNALMTHSMGKSFFIFGPFVIPLYDKSRHYYSIRNYSNLLVSKYISFRFKVLYSIKIPLYIIIFSLNSKKPLSSLKLYFSAFLNGINGNLGKISI